MQARKDLRIGIVGAGAGGLSVAEAPRDKGYSDITIFEKRDRPGGQVYTYAYKTDDQRTILCEMGSVQPFAAGAGALGRLIKRYGLNFGRTITENKIGKFKFYSAAKRSNCRDFTKSPIGFPLTLRNAFLVAADVLKLCWYLFRYRRLGEPGYTHLSSKYLQELSVPKDKWVDSQKFFLIGEDLKYFVGGTLTLMNTEKKNVPAATLLKLILYCFKSPVRYANGAYIAMREGYQELWSRVAAHHRVLYNSEIKQIVRSEDKVEVEAATGVYVFNKIIITCASFEFARFLRLSDAENEVFSKVLYAPGWRAAFIAKHLPHDAIYGFYEAFTNSAFLPALSVLVPEGQIDGETWLYGCIISVKDNGPIEPVLKSVEIFLREHFGGEVIEWVKTVYWPQYSPYFSYENVRSGIYGALEALQGKKSTYYAGDVASSGSNAIVSDYAFDLVERFF